MYKENFPTKKFQFADSSSLNFSKDITRYCLLLNLIVMDSFYYTSRGLCLLSRELNPSGKKARHLGSIGDLFRTLKFATIDKIFIYSRYDY